MALFFDKPDGTLLPIAIQLFQEPAENNPVSKRNNFESWVLLLEDVE